MEGKKNCLLVTWSTSRHVHSSSRLNSTTRRVYRKKKKKKGCFARESNSNKKKKSGVGQKKSDKKARWFPLKERPEKEEKPKKRLCHREQPRSQSCVITRSTKKKDHLCPLVSDMKPPLFQKQIRSTAHPSHFSANRTLAAFFVVVVVVCAFCLLVLFYPTSKAM